MSTDLYVPVRCYSCNKVLANLQRPYEEELSRGYKKPGEILDDLGITRECCRMNMLRPSVVLVPEMNVSETVGEYEVMRRKLNSLSIKTAPALPSGGSLAAMTSSEPISSAGDSRIPAPIYGQGGFRGSQGGFQGGIQYPGRLASISGMPNMPGLGASTIPEGPSARSVRVTSIPMTPSMQPRLPETRSQAPPSQQPLSQQPSSQQLPSRQDLPAGGVITPLPSFESLGLF